MPALTNPRHEAFCRAIVAMLAGKYGSQGEAYVAAGYDAKDAGKRGGSAEACASRLLNRAKPIAARIGELQEQAARKKRITVETIVDELEEARSVAKEATQAAAMVAASTGKAKLLGLVVDRSESGKPGDFTQANDQASVARMLLRNAGMAESEIGEVESAEALEALAHFNERLAAIVTGSRQHGTQAS
jgi:phage terminase small subunit